MTFDDGYHDFADTAWPELERLALPSTLLVTTGALGPPNRCLLPEAAMLTLEEVANLRAAGAGIGAHSYLHAQLDILDSAAVV